MNRAKRVLDVCVAGAVLLAASPVLGAAALAVRLTMGSPVLFRQVRPGLGAQPFTVLKLRTMRIEPGLDDAARITPLGRFLRRTSIDEIPQLWNVLRGDMSLVGPRPLLMQYIELYTPEQARRHEARPGITGWAQVNGRNAVGWEERFRMDVWYVDHRSFLLDVRILLLTLKSVLVREGISQEGQATVERFRGSVA